MNLPEGDDRRKHSRFETALPIRFNLNPDYHYVPAIRKLGVGGTIRNISWEGIAIHSRMDLLDVCQIFYEEMEGDEVFQLEVYNIFPQIIRSQKFYYIQHNQYYIANHGELKDHGVDVSETGYFTYSTFANGFSSFSVRADATEWAARRWVQYEHQGDPAWSCDGVLFKNSWLPE